jgi:hypothetical protein
MNLKTMMERNRDGHDESWRGCRCTNVERWSYRAIKAIGRSPWWLVIVISIALAIAAWLVMAAALAGCGDPCDSRPGYEHPTTAQKESPAPACSGSAASRAASAPAVTHSSLVISRWPPADWTCGRPST